MSCPLGNKESKGRGPASKMKQIQTSNSSRMARPESQTPTPYDFLHSSSDEDDPVNVNVVRVTDQRSVPRCVGVQVQGVPAYGLIDSGADITIIGGTLFKKVATVARFKKRDFMKADKVPRTYDQRPFQLDGRMDLDITFGDHTMKTPVYIKMDAHDQLLLSEGVCRQLGILSYHHSVERWRGGRKKQVQQRSGDVPLQTEIQDNTSTTSEDNQGKLGQGATVPMVRVKLLQSTHVLPHQSRVIKIDLPETSHQSGCYLLEPSSTDPGLRMDPSLIQVLPDEPALA